MPAFSIKTFSLWSGFVCCLIISSHSFAAEQIIWIDVRTPAEFASGHVKNAYNIEFQIIGEQITGATQDKNAQLLLYCKSGRRSGVAKRTLEKLGYQNVTNVGGVRDALRVAEKLKNR